jgi:hypothetical protein
MVRPFACIDSDSGMPTPCIMSRKRAMECARLMNNYFPLQGTFEACNVLSAPDGLSVIGFETWKTIYLEDPGHRVPETQDDWGDDATIGVHLKTQDRHALRYGSEFARFIGKFGVSGLIIGIKDIPGNIIAEVFYPNEAQAKADWQLD